LDLNLKIYIQNDLLNYYKDVFIKHYKNETSF
jgi:hypothetical protein